MSTGSADHKAPLTAARHFCNAGILPAFLTLRSCTSGGSPLLQQGELDFSPAKESEFTFGFSRGKSPSPGLKPTVGGKAFYGALKRSSPRINARAPTERRSRSYFIAHLNTHTQSHSSLGGVDRLAIDQNRNDKERGGRVSYESNHCHILRAAPYRRSICAATTASRHRPRHAPKSTHR